MSLMEIMYLCYGFSQVTLEGFQHSSSHNCNIFLYSSSIQCVTSENIVHFVIRGMKYNNRRVCIIGSFVHPSLQLAPNRVKDKAPNFQNELNAAANKYQPKPDAAYSNEIDCCPKKHLREPQHTG